MKSQASFYRETARRRGDRGSTLAAALALAFLVFVITSACLIQVAASSAQIRVRHRQTSALFLAEAGIQKTAYHLLTDSSYSGERGAGLPGGRFDVTVTGKNGRFVVTSTGFADSPPTAGSKKTVRATVVIESTRSFRVADWRENP